MKKLLNNPLVAGALALAALAFVGHAILGGGKIAHPVVIAETAATEAENSEGTTDTPAAVDIRLALKELTFSPPTRDPFTPRAKVVAQAATATAEKAPAPDVVETLHLSALWTQDGATYALLNNRVCRAGDKLGLLTLSAVTSEGVWVTHWKGRDFIKLGGAFTLTTPALKAAALTLSQDS